MVVLATTAVPALANFSNGPDEAGVVERANYPFGVAFFDEEAGLIALGGPPPELGCIGEGFEDADFQFVSTPAGPVKLLIHDTQTFYIYESTDLGEICDAALSGEPIEPLAVGEAKVRFNDNFDNYEPGSRANPFGGNANGTVYDANGDAWSFHGNVKLKLDRDGNFQLMTESIKLNKRGK